MDYVVPLEKEEALDPAVVGHKFSSLARAHRAGFLVPPAVAVSISAHRFYLRTGNWPDGLLEAVIRHARELGLEQGISVRSSGILEDLESQSFAGQYRTFLDIRDEADLKEKIEACWTSAREAAARSYFQQHRPGGQDGEGPLLAVILQQMVHAAAAGVAFSRNPVFPAMDEVVVESTPGPGESLVSGLITPYRATIRNGRITVLEHPHEIREHDSPLLEDCQWLQVAALARRAEELADGAPRDVEWAIDQAGTLWLLQSRPITTIGKPPSDAPPGAWARKIADDLWADRLTPFMASVMLKNAYRFDLSGVANYFKIPVVKPTLTTINGFLYVNCSSLKQILSAVPAGFRTEDVRSVFPPGFQIDDVPPPTTRRMLLLILRFVRIALARAQANPILCPHATLTRLSAIRERLEAVSRLPSDSIDQSVQKLKEAVHCMMLLQELNQWPYAFATVFVWALHWLVTDCARLEYSCFLHLLHKGARNTTIDIEREMRRIAEKIAGDDRLTDIFVHTPSGELMRFLPDGVRQEIDHFLRRYGVRSRHRSLLEKRWCEAPEQVLKMIAALVKKPEERKAAATDEGTAEPAAVRGIATPGAAADEPANADAVEAALKAGLSWPLRKASGPILSYARRFLDLREELRFFLDRILFLIRRCLLDLGRFSGLGENAMFLTETELIELVWCTMTQERANELIEHRLRAFREEVEVYTFYMAGRPVAEAASDGGIMHGIGTSPGRAAGYARIVSDPASPAIRKGDILIAKHTDPGWTPILSMVGGVVVEEGGLLSHFSIIARELGIPAVVGVRGITGRVSDGSFITIDGSLGTVQTSAKELLEEYEEPRLRDQC